jgi:hypothetical protein
LRLIARDRILEGFDAGVRAAKLVPARLINGCPAASFAYPTGKLAFPDFRP